MPEVGGWKLRPLSLDGRGLEACPGLEPGVRVKHGWEKGLF